MYLVNFAYQIIRGLGIFGIYLGGVVRLLAWSQELDNGGHGGLAVLVGGTGFVLMFAGFWVIPFTMMAIGAAFKGHRHVDETNCSSTCEHPMHSAWLG